MDEFDLIRQYLAPLAAGLPGALNLTDDAALLTVPPGRELVVTKDAIGEGTHFLGSEDPALIARKLLRVNLSDLAAMGAEPLCYFMALMLPSSKMDPRVGPEDDKIGWVKRFAEGLREDQHLFGIHLAGGDTISTQGPLVLSLTALGTVPAGQALKRGAARPGDVVYVSGTLGDSALGLKLLQRNIHTHHGEDRHFLEERYLLPAPRLQLGIRLRDLAHGCMDISDGLVQDLGHICATSGAGAEIRRDKLPLSEAARRLIAVDAALWNDVLAGGDDYELLFTAPPEKELLVADLAKALGLPLTAIGHIIEGDGVHVRDEHGKSVAVERTGFRHF